jgi:hypothetical protein
MACASQQMLQMWNLALDPLGQANSGEQLYHFVGSHMEPAQFGSCKPECLFPPMIAQGDHCPFVVTGIRLVEPSHGFRGGDTQAIRGIGRHIIRAWSYLTN